MARRLDAARSVRRFIAFLGVASCGCSFAFVSGPPSETAPSPGPEEQCTTSVLSPVLDSVGAAVGALNIGIATSAAPGKVSWYGVEMESGTGVALGITQLALFGAGAIYGFVQTSRCNAFLEERPKEPENASWSPALANEEQPPHDARGAAPAVPSPPPRPAVQAESSASPAPPAPTPSARPAATSAPPPASSPSVPTVAFPD
jgi:hypothetical protein